MFDVSSSVVMCVFFMLLCVGVFLIECWCVYSVIVGIVLCCVV